MDRRTILLGLGASALSACKTFDPSVLGGIGGVGGLSQADAAMGIRAALDNGIGNAVGKLGIVDGFLGNKLVRIPLPKVLQDVQSYLRPIGADGLLVELQQQLNRGAEKAVPVAKDIFLDAVSGLSISDAINIVRGPDNAATEYLQSQTSHRLGQLFSPIMENALGQTGALRLVDQISGQLSSVPIAPQLGRDARSDLIKHGVDFGLDGLFYYIAEEEKAIRDNPAKRTSVILRRVFGVI